MARLGSGTALARNHCDRVDRHFLRAEHRPITLSPSALPLFPGPGAIRDVALLPAQERARDWIWRSEHPAIPGVARDRSSQWKSPMGVALVPGRDSDDRAGRQPGRMASILPAFAHGYSSRRGARQRGRSRGAGACVSRMSRMEDWRSQRGMVAGRPPAPKLNSRGAGLTAG